MLEYLSLLADACLALAAIGAVVYCLRLGRKLQRFSSIDNGLGGAIAVLSRQVDEMTAALSEAKEGTAAAEARLESALVEARRVCDRLDLLVAGCHDIGLEAAEAPLPLAEDPEPDLTAPLFSSIAQIGRRSQADRLQFRHRMAEER